MSGKDFRNCVYEMIAAVPRGKVTTYGDLAALCGHANCARIIGGIAHYGDLNLPWRRLVNKFGGLASEFPGGREVQAKLLSYEGVHCTDYVVDNFKELRWNPKI
jgi:methylated-DNA-protein-cysteine methyltransferase-like protein